MFASDTLGDHDDDADSVRLPAYYAAFDRIVGSANDMLFVAEFCGEVAGTCQIVLITSLPGRGATNMLIKAVHTRHDLRGRGIGGTMMRHCIDLARQKGVSLVQLASNRDRKDAHRFYERLGFSQTHLGFTLHLD